MNNSTLLSLLDITGAPARNEAQMPGYELKSDAECGCPNCHRVFSSERAFDLHRGDDIPRVVNALKTSPRWVWSLIPEADGGQSDE